jgi:hypothetical protein
VVVHVNKPAQFADEGFEESAAACRCDYVSLVTVRCADENDTDLMLLADRACTVNKSVFSEI